MKKTAAQEQNERPLSFFSGWKYAPAPESTDHISLKKQYGLFINGEFVPPCPKNISTPSIPRREQKIAEIAEADEKDVDRAVTAASNAYNSLSGKGPRRRNARNISSASPG
jgi:aldehyde dehydrogenase (NAD+)